MTIAPATPVPDPNLELRRAVALAYRAIRRQRGREVPAWEAARQTVLDLRPGTSEDDAGRIATLILAWAATEHPKWFWSGVGQQNEDEAG